MTYKTMRYARTRGAPLRMTTSHKKEAPTPLKQHQGFRLPIMGLGGLEPPTSRLSGVRSNHLSYRPPNPDRLSVVRS